MEILSILILFLLFPIIEELITSIVKSIQHIHVSSPVPPPPPGLGVLREKVYKDAQELYNDWVRYYNSKNGNVTYLDFINWLKRHHMPVIFFYTSPPICNIYLQFGVRVPIAEHVNINSKVPFDIIYTLINAYYTAILQTLQKYG